MSAESRSVWWRQRRRSSRHQTRRLEAGTETEHPKSTKDAGGGSRPSRCDIARLFLSFFSAVFSGGNLANKHGLRTNEVRTQRTCGFLGSVVEVSAESRSVWWRQRRRSSRHQTRRLEADTETEHPKNHKDAGAVKRPSPCLFARLEPSALFDTSDVQPTQRRAARSAASRNQKVFSVPTNAQW